MSEPKSFASLGPTLLARKGGAKPAMRPQLAAMSAIGSAQIAETIAHDLEDLGWNDMGSHEDEEAHEAQIIALTPAPANRQTDAENRLADAAAHAEMAGLVPPEPEVLRQQRAVAAAVVARAPEPSLERHASERSPESSRRNALDTGRRAAFTLRLDARRHLMLRLASTVKNRSAQQLVTAALDKFLADIPEIEALAAQVKRDRNDR